MTSADMRSRAKDFLLEARRLRKDAKQHTLTLREQLLGQSDGCRFMARVLLANLRKMS